MQLGCQSGGMNTLGLRTSNIGTELADEKFIPL
jgi:hypothetical protein